MGLPSLLFLVAWAFLGIATASASLRCDDASRAGARALARGEPADAVIRAVRDAGPHDAQVEVRRSTGTAEVRCSARVELAGLRTFTVHARSVAAVEDPGDVLSGGVPVGAP